MLMAYDVGEELERLRADARYLAFLSRAGELLGESLDYRETLRNVCAAAVETVADVCLIHLQEHGEIRLVAAAHRDPSRNAEVQHAGAYLEGQEGRTRHAVRRVIESGEVFAVPFIDDVWIAANATSERHARYMRDIGYASMIVAPVVSTVYGITGALTLVTIEDGSPALAGDDALLFAADLGRRCGTAIGKARMFADTAAVAERFQRAALPNVLPDVPKLQVSALYEPAHSSLLVGGDWYDLFMLPDGRVGLSMGDVSGHGLEAAVTMASMKNAMHTALVMKPDLVAALDAGDFVMRHEKRLQDAPLFCTAMVAIFDPATLELQCAAAGHPGPRIWDPATSQVLDPFKERGLPLGCRDLAPSANNARGITLSDGAFVVFYTDGLVESERDLIASERKLEETIRHRSIRKSANPAVSIRQAVASATPRDDVAILTLLLSER